jgi:hypothetical protein
MKTSASSLVCPGRLAAPLSRRQLLRSSANGFGLLALSALLADRAYGAGEAKAPQIPRPHFKPKAKNVIFCFMDGGVSHVDSFDPKPGLDKRDGQVYQGGRKWLKSPWKFAAHGKCRTPVSELFPQIASCMDDIAVIRSMKADLPLHSTGVLLLHTGLNNAGRPSLGSWVTYGLGSENRNLPGFVVLNFDTVPCGGLENFSSGFLPASQQASILKADGTPIDNITPADKDRRLQRAKLDLLLKQDQAFAASLGSDAVESAIRNYEMAYRMQSLVPDVLDLGKESAATRKLYGIDSSFDPQRLYGIQCLRARRLVESSVRFVEVNCPSLAASNGTWDQHGDLKKGHEKNARVTDQAVAGLLKDLKSRGLLEETLVLWAGEFGRTPHAPGRDGRDHHPEGFSVWMAGGGIKGGVVTGATDEMGMHAVDNVCTIHDLHATILHLLGLDHEKLTYRFGGRDFRLTDVHGRIVDEVLALPVE